MMDKECGDKECKVWLIGDSNPKNWERDLDKPLDSRHPIRHNIWTSIFNVIQNNVFLEMGNRIDESKIYIRNAIEDAGKKPKRNVLIWEDEDYLNKSLDEFKKLVDENKPILILTFGAFSYEFVRRALGNESKKYGYWDTKKLGNEFRLGINNYNNHKQNVLPLLHRSIAGGRFIVSHDNFSGKDSNYFDYTGEKISSILISDKENYNLWMK